MNDTISEVADALDALGQKVLKGWSEDRTLNEAFGWNAPALTRHDLAGRAHELANRLREVIAEDGDLPDAPEAEERAASLVSQLRNLGQQTVPQIYNGGNSGVAAQVYLSTLDNVEFVLAPYLAPWVRVDDPDTMPHKLAKRVRSLRARIDKLEPEVDDLNATLELISGAAEAADSLPTDMQELREARAEIKAASKAVLGYETDSKNSAKEIGDLLEEARSSTAEAKSMTQQLRELHRIGTSTALAGAFLSRAKTLDRSMYFWLFVLVLALAGVGILGTMRLELLSATLHREDFSLSLFLGHSLVSLFSVGAPIWLAWVATKQIGQRFRLAEDYGYKASISNAYEGYRREAEGLDDEFTARLFGSALSRLDEIPLRLVEQDSHGSPFHEFVNSAEFKRAIDSSDGLRSKFSKLFPLLNKGSGGVDGGGRHASDSEGEKSKD